MVYGTGEDLLRFSLNGLAVSEGIGTCLQAGVVDGDGPHAALTRRLLYYLLVHFRAFLAAAEDPNALVEAAMLYEMVGPAASRELARRTQGQLGASGGLLQLFERTRAAVHSGPVERAIERELERLRSGVLGTKLRKLGPAGPALRRLDPNAVARGVNGRLLHDPKALFGNVDGPLWEEITAAAASQHPLEALVRSVNREWNVIPQRAAWRAVNLARREATRHAKWSVGTPHLCGDKDGDSSKIPTDRVLPLAREHGRDEFQIVREHLEHLVSVAKRISARFAEALSTVQEAPDSRAELAQRVADTALVSVQHARTWLRRLEKELKTEKS